MTHILLYLLHKSLTSNCLLLFLRHRIHITDSPDTEFTSGSQDRWLQASWPGLLRTRCLLPPAGGSRLQAGKSGRPWGCQVLSVEISAQVSQQGREFIPGRANRDISFYPCRSETGSEGQTQTDRASRALTGTAGAGAPSLGNVPERCLFPPVGPGG